MRMQRDHLHSPSYGQVVWFVQSLVLVSAQACNARVPSQDSMPVHVYLRSQRIMHGGQLCTPCKIVGTSDGLLRTTIVQ